MFCRQFSHYRGKRSPFKFNPVCKLYMPSLCLSANILLLQLLLLLQTTKCINEAWCAIFVNAGLETRGCREPRASLNSPAAPANFCREPKDVLVSIQTPLGSFWRCNWAPWKKKLISNPEMGWFVWRVWWFYMWLACNCISENES